MRLGELLLSDGQVAPEQLAEALRRQVLHGGRLGTNLVELSHLSLENLAKALGQQHHLPAATKAHFESLSPTLLEKLSPEMAATWHAIPLGRTGPEASIVAIATPDPMPPETIAKLQEAFDSEIAVAICPELRMLYWLEAAYGIERANRFKRIHTREEKDSGKFDERRAYMQTLADTAKPTPTSQLARVAIQKVTVQRSDFIKVPIGLLDFEEAIRVIRQSNGRSRLADQVTELLQNGFDNTISACALLTLRGPLAIGWKGFSNKRDSMCLDDMALPIDDSTLFAPPVENGEVLTQVAGDMGEPPSLVDQRFWEYLGNTSGSAPNFLAVYPVRVLDEIVALLYLQSDLPLSVETTSRITQIVSAISTTVTRLIRAANR